MADDVERACGDCTACCTVLAVRELGKEASRRCEHLGSSGGCGVYETRPASCADYRCGWLTGFGAGRSTRPDRLGVILDKPASMKGEIVAREVFRGAFDRRRVREILERLHREGNRVRLVPFAGRKLPVGRAL
jgi:hypothetical protein